MDNIESDFDFINSINTQTFFIVLFILLALAYYFKGKLDVYLARREKLKKMAENYERKRECRKGLAVRIFYYSITIIGN